MAVERIELPYEGDGDWSCYDCCDVRDRVVELDHLRRKDATLEFLCERCLFNRVQDGTIIVSHFTTQPEPEKSGFDWPRELAATFEAIDTPPLAVANDDGTVTTDDGIQISW